MRAPFHRCISCLVLALFAILLSLNAPAGVGAVTSGPSLGEPPRAPDRPAGAPLAPVVTRAAGCTTGHCVYLPTISRPADNPRVRSYSLDLYNQAYLGSAGVAHGWNGNIAACSPGTTRPAFRNSVLLRINYFREMAGVPKLTGLNASYNQMDQSAALMMAANQDLNHNPPTSWKCYTGLGKDGAGSSNLALGAYGPNAISLYMDDGGVGSLGHRRWVLYPQTQQMGTGDIPGAAWYNQSNAMRAWDDHMWESRPDTRDEFVAWPPAAYVPYTVVYPVWSFSMADADFSSATVVLRSNGATIPTSITTRTDNGYGENTLGWNACSGCGTWPNPGADKAYQVTVSNVRIDGTPHSYSYTVTVFAP